MEAMEYLSLTFVDLGSKRNAYDLEYERNRTKCEEGKEFTFSGIYKVRNTATKLINVWLQLYTW